MRLQTLEEVKFARKVQFKLDFESRPLIITFQQSVN